MNPARVLFLLSVSCLVLLLTGCHTQYNRMHFAAVDVDQEYPEIKFYRLTVHGHSWGTSTEMLTGKYDARALQQLYGDIVKDSEVEMVSSGGQKYKAHVFQLDSDKRTPEYISPDERFTIFYGANAGSIAQQVSEFAKSDETGKLLGRLMVAATHGEKVEAALLAERDLAATQTSVAELKAEIDAAKQALRKLIPTPTPTPAPGATTAAAPTAVEVAKVTPHLLKVVQKASNALGSTETYADDLEGWKKSKIVYDILVKSNSK